MACVLLGVDASALAADRTLLGQLLETFVYQELRRQASWQTDLLTFFHFRDKDGAEVDIVIERGTQALAGVEIKAGATVRAADFQALRKLKKAAGRRFAGGVVLYDGEMCVRFDDDLYAVPCRCVLSGRCGNETGLRFSVSAEIPAIAIRPAWITHSGS